MKRRIKVTIANKKQTQNTNPSKEVKDSDIMYFNIYTLVSSGYPKYSFYHISKGTDGKVNDIDSIMKSFDVCYNMLYTTCPEIYPIDKELYKIYKSKIMKGEFTLTNSIKMNITHDKYSVKCENHIDIIYAIFENDFILSKGKVYDDCKKLVNDDVTYIIKCLKNNFHCNDCTTLNTMNSISYYIISNCMCILTSIAYGVHSKDTFHDGIQISKYIAIAVLVYAQLIDLAFADSFDEDHSTKEETSKKSSEAYLVFIKNVNTNKNLHIRVPSEEGIGKLKDKLKKYENLKYLDQVNISNFETSIDTKVKVLYGFYRMLNDNYARMENIESMVKDTYMRNIFEEMIKTSSKIRDCSLEHPLEYITLYKNFEQKNKTTMEFPNELIIDTALQITNNFQ